MIEDIEKQKHLKLLRDGDGCFQSVQFEDQGGINMGGGGRGEVVSFWDAGGWQERGGKQLGLENFGLSPMHGVWRLSHN